MAKQRSDLTVQLSGAPYSFLWPDNVPFLYGKRPHPQFYDTYPERTRVMGCIFLFVLFNIGLIVLCGTMVYVTLWHSPLAVKTTAMIGEYRDGAVSYHYFAGSTRYDKIEQASRFEPTWDSLEPRQPVIYLIFDPSQSLLDFNIPSLAPVMAIAALFFLLPTFRGWRIFRMILWEVRCQTTLCDEATHLIEGRVIMKTPGHFGWTTYLYAAKSPTTGVEIRASFFIHHTSSRHGRFHQGTLVAILYRDDKLYWML